MLLLLFTLSAARADDAVHDRVVDLLSAFEDAPGAAEWRALGPGAADELLEVARDQAQLPTRRGNALVALGWFPTDAAWAHLVAVATTPGGEVLLRRKACAGLANGWGDRALPVLTTMLEDPDVQLRTSAARAVARIATPAARALLRERLAVETAPSVQTVLAAGSTP